MNRIVYACLLVMLVLVMGKPAHAQENETTRIKVNLDQVEPQEPSPSGPREAEARFAAAYSIFATDGFATWNIVLTGLQAHTALSHDSHEEQRQQSRRFYGLYITGPLGGTVRIASFDTGGNFNRGDYVNEGLVPFDFFNPFDGQPLTVEIVEEADDGVDSCHPVTGCAAAFVWMRGTSN